MSSFLYYVPGHQADMISREQISAAGLDYVFEKRDGITCNALRSSGPDGKSGAIITNPGRIEPGRSVFKPEQQTWVKNEASGVYVGMWNDAQPGPDTLERRKMLDGRKLELDDEREWLIPVARHWQESSNSDRILDSVVNLPCSIGFGPNGSVHLQRVLPRYEKLWALCGADHRYSTGKGTEADIALVGGNNVVHAAVTVLQGNYVVGATEVEMLGLLSQSTPREILDIFGDWENWQRIVDAKLSATPAEA